MAEYLSEEDMNTGEYISRDVALRQLNATCLATDCNNYNGVRCRACAYADVMDFIDAIPAADAQPIDRWIDAQKNPPPVVDRRSMTSESVLILRDNGRCAVAYYCYDAEDGNYWTTDDDKTMYAWEEVTHWQPLPELPREDNINE